MFLSKRNLNTVVLSFKDSVDHFLSVSLDFHYFCLAFGCKKTISRRIANVISDTQWTAVSTAVSCIETDCE